jgi:hypothetical protein
MTIFKRHHRLLDGALLHAGDELPPGLLEPDVIDMLLDADILVEIPSRLSYFALLHDFSGVEASTENVSIRYIFPEICVQSRLDSKPEKA